MDASLIYIIVFLAIFLIFLWLPQRKMQKRYTAMLQATKAGDNIETISRIRGVVVEVVGDCVVVDLGAHGDRVRVKMSLEGIARNFTAEENASGKGSKSEKDNAKDPLK